MNEKLSQQGMNCSLSVPGHENKCVGKNTAQKFQCPRNMAKFKSILRYVAYEYNIRNMFNTWLTN